MARKVWQTLCGRQPQVLVSYRPTAGVGKQANQSSESRRVQRCARFTSAKQHRAPSVEKDAISSAEQLLRFECPGAPPQPPPLPACPAVPATPPFVRPCLRTPFKPPPQTACPAASCSCRLPAPALASFPAGTLPQHAAAGSSGAPSAVEKRAAGRANAVDGVTGAPATIDNRGAGRAWGAVEGAAGTRQLAVDWCS